VSAYERELHECLGILLGATQPVPDYEPFLFYKQWLAERNLGLVPIADAAEFDWPGHPPDAESPLAPVERAEAVAGRGLEGDRYHDGRGTFSGPGHGYQLTILEAEVLDSIDLPWEQARRNNVTRGIALNALVGRRFTVGRVECVGRRLAEP
jgi:hypothetical protein